MVSNSNRTSTPAGRIGLRASPNSGSFQGGGRFSRTDGLSSGLIQRLKFAPFLLALVFLLLGMRLWHLQIMRREELTIRSENNRIRTVFVPAPRGEISDRFGKKLVTNRPSFNVEFIPEDSPNPKETLRRLAELLGYPQEKFLEKLKGDLRRRRFEPRLVLKDVDRDTVAKVSVRRHELPGVLINVVPARNYMEGSLAAHTIGYIHEISQKRLESNPEGRYLAGDLVGQAGLEQEWEEYLRGERGSRQVVVNAAGNRIADGDRIREKAGQSLTLTLDLAVQRAADNALATTGKSGAIVALDAKTGEVLALSSGPTFDPNSFVGDLSTEFWKTIKDPVSRPLFNRAIQGGYPPGSVYKPFIASAALAEDVVSRQEKIFCPGYLKFGNRRWACHKETGHGSEDLRHALIESCNVFFYTMGQRLGVDRMYEYASSFGFGRKTGLEIPHESAGLLPSTAWKRRAFRKREDQKWHPGETLPVAIGQGATLTSPLQVAVAMAALVNGGQILRPWLVKQINSLDGKFVDDSFTKEVSSRVNVSDKILEIVKEDLVGVVNDPKGTGRRAKLMDFADVTVGGKTGTAQAGVISDRGGARKSGTHAWFAGFAPAEDPEIVVAAIVEFAGHGGEVAAPLVNQVMTAYFKERRPLNPVVAKANSAKNGGANEPQQIAAD